MSYWGNTVLPDEWAEEKEIEEEIIEAQELLEKYENNLYRINKIQLTCKYDKDVLDWFKAKGKGYQAHLNAALKAVIESIDMEKLSFIPEADEFPYKSYSRKDEKVSCTARYDADVVRWYKMWGKGYRKLMNNALRAVMEAEMTCRDL